MSKSMPVAATASNRRGSVFLQQIQRDWRLCRLAVLGEMISAVTGIAGALTLAAFSGAAPMGMLFPIWLLGSLAGILAGLVRRNAVTIGQGVFHASMNAYGLFSWLGNTGILDGVEQRVQVAMTAVRAAILAGS